MRRELFTYSTFIVLTLSTFWLTAQTRVSGTVTDVDGEPLIGANILVEGTSNGTTTDFDGNYELNGLSATSVLIYSYTGMETTSEVVGNRSEINVQLTGLVLDEVVVTALGISREKKALGYSVAEVDGDQLRVATQENVMNALTGKVAGVDINATGGAGSSVSMVIRGATSLTSDNQPLFVVDGVPINSTLNNVSEIGRDNRVDFGNAISDLNPDDIASISVLKGPSAAALYGSRAANGVVLITTKSPNKNKGLGISINSSTVVDVPYKFFQGHTLFATGSRPYTPSNFPTNEYGQLLIGESSAAWVGPELDKGYSAIQWPFQVDANGDPVATPLVSYPDNAKNFLQNGVTSTNNIAFSNVLNNFSYRISYTNMSNRGVIPNTDLFRNSLNIASEYEVSPKFKLSTNININKTNSNNRPAGNRGANPLQALFEINPHINVLDMKDYWEDGLEGLQQKSPYEFGSFDEREWNNPYFLAYEALNSFNRNRMFGNLKAEYQITPALSIMARFAQDQYGEERETKVANSYTQESNGIYGLINLDRVERNTDFLLSYNKRVSDFSVYLSGGGNVLYQNWRDTRNATKYRGSGLVIPGLYNLSNIAPDNLDYSSNSYKKVIYSLYGQASLGFKDMVYLDLTGRNDWSSTLPSDNRSYFYPSVSLSWLLNETFSLPSYVSLAKLRAGWAQVGNDTDPYRLFPVLGNSGAWDGVTRLNSSSNLLTPGLKPEIQTSQEIGLDLNFLKDRLRFEATLYHSENKNQILGIGLPSSSGYTSKLINAGLIASRGVELTLGFVPIKSQNLMWDVNLVYFKNRTTIEELTDGIDYIRLWSDAKGGAYTWVGEEIGQIIDRRLVTVDDPSSPYNGWTLLDEDGSWNDDNTLQVDGKRVAPVIGNFNPKFTLGMQTSIDYKAFSFSASFTWRNGGDFVSQTLRYGESDLHSARWLNSTVKFDGTSDQLVQFLKDNEDKYLKGEITVVGGPTAEYGGFEHSEGGITLHDGVFNPGVIAIEDEDGNITGYQENLGGPGTKYIRYQDNYPWSFTKAATFDASFIKLREISASYRLPKNFIQSLGFQSASIGIFSRNIMLWTKAKINIDPELAFQPETGTQGSGIQFKQGIERFNLYPWVLPIGVKLNVNL